MCAVILTGTLGGGDIIDSCDINRILNTNLSCFKSFYTVVLELIANNGNVAHIVVILVGWRRLHSFIYTFHYSYIYNKLSVKKISTFILKVLNIRHQSRIF